MLSEEFETVEVEREAIDKKKDGRAPMQIGIRVIALRLIIGREIQDADQNQKKIINSNFANVE